MSDACKELEAKVKVKLWFGIALICGLIPSCLAFGQQVRLDEGTPVRLRLKADLGSDQVAEGARVDFEVAHAVMIQGIPVIPEGAAAWGAVQSVKKGKFIKFDIEGVRLADLTNVKLRCLGVKAKNSGQDEIKVETSFKGGVGAAKGTEYTAYIDEAKEIASGGPSSNPALPAAPAPSGQAETLVPASAAAVGSTPSSVTSSVNPTAPVAHAAVSTPAAPAAAGTPAASPIVSPAQPATPIANVERVKVECFSDPTAGDILIDGEFYGNTPSFLKVPVGKHTLAIELAGYKTWSLTLILQPGTAVRTIRASLEPKD